MSKDTLYLRFSKILDTNFVNNRSFYHQAPFLLSVALS